MHTRDVQQVQGITGAQLRITGVPVKVPTPVSATGPVISTAAPVHCTDADLIALAVACAVVGCVPVPTTRSLHVDWPTAPCRCSTAARTVRRTSCSARALPMAAHSIRVLRCAGRTLFADVLRGSAQGDGRTAQHGSPCLDERQKLKGCRVRAQALGPGVSSPLRTFRILNMDLGNQAARYRCLFSHVPA